MHQVVEEIKSRLEELPDNYEEVTYLLAVSGGIDSMVLLSAFVKLRLNFKVAHCNFQLRGYESYEEEEFVMAHCESLNVPVEVCRFDTNDHKKGGESIQMVARRLRYEWFEQLQQKHRLKYLVLAHHLDDQIESFFINFLRGTGIRGLMGMQLLAGDRLRPMLNLTRNQIEHYANYMELEYREDSSNLDHKYVRNKIRHNVMPLMKEIRPEIHQIFIGNNRKLNEAQEALDYSLAELTTDLNPEQIDKNWFNELPFYYRHAYLSAFGFSASQIVDMATASVGSSFFAGNWVLDVNRESLSLRVNSEPEKAQRYLESDEKVVLHELEFALKEVEGAQIVTDENVAALDLDTLEFPLKIRSWQEGDSFVPLGMSGEKKLSDFFTDQKMGRLEKEQQLIIENGNGAIVWVVGKRISDLFKVTDQTKQTLLIETNLH